MRRQPLDRFAMWDTSKSHNENVLRRTQNHRQALIEQKRFFSNMDYRDCELAKEAEIMFGNNDDWTYEENEDMDQDQEMPELLPESPEDYAEFYESIEFQCPSLMCLGHIQTTDKGEYNCTNNECPVKINFLVVPVDLKLLIERLKVKYVEHKKTGCSYVPKPISHEGNLCITCWFCECNLIV